MNEFVDICGKLIVVQEYSIGKKELYSWVTCATKIPCFA